MAASCSTNDAWSSVPAGGAPDGCMAALGSMVHLHTPPASEVLPQAMQTAIQQQQRRLPWRQSDLWARAAATTIRASSPVQISVIGASVTSGCGAAEPWLQNEINESEWHQGTSSMVVGRCAVGRSWGHRMHEELNTLLLRMRSNHTRAPSGADTPCEARTHLSFKNAGAWREVARDRTRRLLTPRDLSIARC